MRILLTNDDGIHAPGLKVLEDIAAHLSTDVWVVAPDDEQSAASHSLTISAPLRVRRLSERRFAVRGTPTDCVLMAVQHLIPAESPPHLLLSGVNRGGNIADDITYSGTVAGAMEGSILAIPSIALSQTRDYAEGGNGTTRWDTARTHGAPLIASLLRLGWPRDVLLNVNFPDVAADKVTGVRLARQGKRDQSLTRITRRIDPHGAPYYWIGFEGIPEHPLPDSDLAAIAAGHISVTPLHLDLTHEATYAHLAANLATQLRASRASR